MAQAAPFVMTASRSKDALHPTEVISNLAPDPGGACLLVWFCTSDAPITRDLELASYGEKEERNTFPICSENLRFRLAPSPYADAKGKDGGKGGWTQY